MGDSGYGAEGTVGQFPYIYILGFIFMKMGKKSALIRMKCF